MSRSNDFNWGAAEADVLDACGDVDRLYTKNEKSRDSYLREMDLNPNRYKTGGGGSSSNNEGCYVATCVYGSYDCPEVWTLRRFRDDFLAKSFPGRAFIRTYYAVSPTIVRWFGGFESFRSFWKKPLDRMVRKLSDKGVENTPYQDKDWRQ